MRRRLEGKIALITGAAGGIGHAAARRFVQEGAKVVLVDHDAEALRTAAAPLGDDATTVPADVSDEAAMGRAVEAALARHGRVDAALLNAGTEGRFCPIEEVSLADFDRVMAVNVRGVLIGLAKLFPPMRRQGGGSVVITSSTGGIRGSAHLAPYVTSKHAVIGLMRTAALEGAAARIRVNTINPGPVETRMMRSIESGRRPDEPEKARAATAAAIPLKRYADPDEIASVMLFLASDEASYCTGGVYMADGGAGAGVAR